jgi:hypothetical protein
MFFFCVLKIFVIVIDMCYTCINFQGKRLAIIIKFLFKLHGIYVLQRNGVVICHLGGWEGATLVYKFAFAH